MIRYRIRPKILEWSNTVGSVVLLGLFLTFLLYFIWPGELAYLAGVVCPESQPELVTLYVDSEYEAGVTDSFLYCLGPRGDHTNIRLVGPFFLLSLLHAGILAVLAVLVVAVRLLRSRGDPAG